MNMNKVEITGYEYLAKKNVELGAKEVDRVERYSVFDLILEDIINHDHMDVPLPTELIDEVWSDAVKSADSRQAYLKKLGDA